MSLMSKDFKLLADLLMLGESWEIVINEAGQMETKITGSADSVKKGLDYLQERYYKDAIDSITKELKKVTWGASSNVKG
jgi:hypothetical protein